MPLYLLYKSNYALGLEANIVTKISWMNVHSWNYYKNYTTNFGLFNLVLFSSFTFCLKISCIGYRQPRVISRICFFCLTSTTVLFWDPFTFCTAHISVGHVILFFLILRLVYPSSIPIFRKIRCVASLNEIFFRTHFLALQIKENKAQHVAPGTCVIRTHNFSITRRALYHQATTAGWKLMDNINGQWDV